MTTKVAEKFPLAEKCRLAHFLRRTQKCSLEPLLLHNRGKWDEAMWESILSIRFSLLWTTFEPLAGAGEKADDGLAIIESRAAPDSAGKLRKGRESGRSERDTQFENFPAKLSHLKSLLLSQALFLLISRIVSIFSKFCGNPKCREESLGRRAGKIAVKIFTSTCFGRHQLTWRLRYRVHDKSIKFTAQDTRKMVFLLFFSLFVTQQDETENLVLHSLRFSKQLRAIVSVDDVLLKAPVGGKTLQLLIMMEIWVN